MNDNARILVVDDDADVRWMVQKYLSKHGMHVALAEDGQQLRAMIEVDPYDLVVLDINMPGEDGLSLARFLRENHSVGIIMLTAAADVFDRVVGLEMGADDYVTKPFEPRELLARIKSVLRRLEQGRDQGGEARSRDGRYVHFGHYVLDLEAHRLCDANNENVAITSMEYDLLKAFADNPDKVLNRDQLLNLAHNKDWDPFDRSIDIRIARLRRKIEPDPSKPQIIKTVRGAGYIFVTRGE